MKKTFLSAVALAAFGLAGTAQADLIDGVGNTISQIFGIPYSPTASSTAPVVNVYTDAYGRRYHIDAAGRHVPMDQYGSYRDQWGRTIYLGRNNQPVYVEQNGQLIPYAAAGGTAVMGAGPHDRDGDGVPNRYDRYPNDSRYR